MERAIANDESEALMEGGGARPISYTLLKEATNSFAIVYEQSYGSIVYEATIRSRRGESKVLAVKKLLRGPFPEQSREKFQVEKSSIGNIIHLNLVKLAGWCDERGELFLVYDAFRPECRLDNLLYNDDQVLDWTQRYKIACGLAYGVKHLHTTVPDKGVIHRDIKPESSVVDPKDSTGKLGNFWLARAIDEHRSRINAGTLAWGTYDYMAPEIYYVGARASKESDVYSFGMLLLELATGKRPRGADECRSSPMPMVSYVWEIILGAEKGDNIVLEAVDLRVRHQITTADEIKEAENLLRLGLWCCDTIPSDRPQMSKVVAVLNRHANLPDGRPKYPILNVRRRDDDEPPLNTNVTAHPAERNYETAKISYSDLREAAGGFSDRACLLGQGDFGAVYRAVFQNPEETVAVKRVIFRDGTRNREQLRLEIINQLDLNHRNLVILKNWASPDIQNEFPEEILLVFEYMENLSLDTHLFDTEPAPPTELVLSNPPPIKKKEVLSWGNRYNIAGGLASAVEYLHHQAPRRVIHQDIKSANVMLDPQFNPKLGDFGLSGFIENGSGTTSRGYSHGYAAPELLTGLAREATTKSDVFAFGIVAMEIATGRRPYGEIPLLSWVSNFHKEKIILSAVDKRVLQGDDQSSDFDETEARRLLQVALWCCNARSSERPSMSQVVAVLDGDIPLSFVELQIKPLEGYYAAFTS